MINYGINYWIASTYNRSKRYACLFTSIKDTELYLKSILRDTPSIDDCEVLQNNFEIRSFYLRSEAIGYRDRFLGL